MGPRRRRADARTGACPQSDDADRDMIVFRQVDARYPFLWDDDRQRAGPWPPDGAWAEFLRHEEITDLQDLPTIRRQMWAVEIGEPPVQHVDLPRSVLTGVRDTSGS